jgi:ABC-2 type transport system permease protein
MNSLLTSEALKLRTLLLPRATLALAAALSGVIGFAVVRIAADSDETVTLADVATASAQPMWFLAVVVAVLATAGEFQHRTIRTTLLQAPRRGQVLAAKAAVSAAYGAALAFIGTVAALAAGMVTMHVYGMNAAANGHLFSAAAASILLGALWAVLAAGLGVLVRNSTFALVAVLVWKFVIENVIPLVANAPLARRWMPSSAADAVLYDGDGTTLLQPLAGGLLFAAYTALVMVAGSLLFLRRDPA